MCVGKLCDMDDDYNVPDLPVDSPPYYKYQEDEGDDSCAQGEHIFR